MTNSVILQKLEELIIGIYPAELDLFDQYSDDIKQDLYYAATLPPINSSILPLFTDCKDETFYTNAYLKLLFDYYLDNFDFSVPRDVEKVTEYIGVLIDQILSKGIPYKNLIEHYKYTKGFSDIEAVISLDRTHTHLAKFAQADKGNAYPAFLKIRIFRLHPL